MLSPERLGRMWFRVKDPLSEELVNVRIDSMRQETFSPLTPSALILSFSTIGGDLSLEELYACTPTPFVVGANQERELVLMVNFAMGTNPVRLFDRAMSVVGKIALGGRTSLPLSTYRHHMAVTQRMRPFYMDRQTLDSPTGRVAVWDITLVREYGLVDNLLSLTRQYATYLAGQMGESEVLPGGLYDFPADFRLEAEVEDASGYLPLMEELVDKVLAEDLLDLVVPYLCQ